MRKFALTSDQREVVRALRRLEESSTKLTRARARTSLGRVISKTLKKFPLLAKDGAPRKARKGAVCTCPLCKCPLKTWAIARAHFVVKHKASLKVETKLVKRRIRTGGKFDPVTVENVRVTRIRCFGCEKTAVNEHGIDRHLQHVAARGELATHLAHAVTRNAFAEPSGEGAGGMMMLAKITRTKTYKFDSSGRSMMAVEFEAADGKRMIDRVALKPGSRKKRVGLLQGV